MLPPWAMLATKNSLFPTVWLALLSSAAVFLTGCTPAGPRALLDGERLLKEHKYPQAVNRLETAARLLPANAQAWNYLGLAYHKAGQANNAAKAYDQARRLDPNLTAVRYNLGSLLLEQDNPQAAATELTAYTLLQHDSAEGWLKLGQAQLRIRQWDSAERSLQNAVRLQPNSAEAWNALGVIHTQRRRSKEALTCFSQALLKRPDYAPALLNVAILNHHYLNNRPLALQKYQEYVSLTPKPRDAAAVEDLVRQLRIELTPPPRREPPEVAAAPPANPNGLPSTTNSPPRAVSPPPAPVRVVTNALVGRPTPEPGSTPASNTPPARPRPANNTVAALSEPKPAPHANPEPPKTTESAPPAVVNQAPKTDAPPPTTAPTPAPAPAEVVQVDDAPAPKPALDTVTPSEPPVPPPQTEHAASATASSADPLRPRADVLEPREKKRVTLNPATWFKGRKRTAATPTATETVAETRPEPAPEPERQTSTVAKPAEVPAAPVIRRYSYLNPTKPAAGNRRKAESYFAQAVQAHHDRRLGEAVENYRQAINLDPSFFEAHYNLGLADYELKDLKESLSAYETALSINPTSVNGRYNFALALEAAGYYQDAANELEKLLEQRPDETRCHLSLASLYAERLDKPELARPHYRRVLELEPAHPKAGAIRYWLAANP